MPTPEEALRQEQERRIHERWERKKRREARFDRAGSALMWYFFTLVFSIIIIGFVLLIFDREIMDTPAAWVAVGSLSAWASAVGWTAKREEQEGRV